MNRMNRVFAAVNCVYKANEAHIDLKPYFKTLALELASVRRPHTIEAPVEMETCNRIMYAVLQTVYDGDIDYMVKMANFLDNWGKTWCKRHHADYYETNYEEYIFS